MRTIFSIGLLFGLTAVGVNAQWPKSSRADVPRRADGGINLDAPAPRMPDGKTPDFSGIWMTETVPCEKTPLETFGCSDTILGVPIGAIHIAATGEKDIVTGRPLPEPEEQPGEQPAGEVPAHVAPAAMGRLQSAEDRAVA